MKINFKPQKLVRSLVLEQKVGQGVRRVLDVQGAKRKTIDMTLSPALNSYPKEYYVSSYKVYDSTGTLAKAMNKNDNGNTVVSTRNFDGTYSSKIID